MCALGHLALLFGLAGAHHPHEQSFAVQVCKLALEALQGLLKQYPGPVGHQAKSLVPVVVSGLQP